MSIKKGLSMQVALRITGGELNETRLLFPPGQYLFGRAQGCHVLFGPSSVASRRHCLILVTDTGVLVRDLMSRNGTFLNNRRIAGDQKLTEGDLLRVAETTFFVEINPTETADPMVGVEVTGKPLGETIDTPLDRTSFETKLSK
jgi:pSer/pThr/pTyr-binding forkhead associated (FHA) protein